MTGRICKPLPAIPAISLGTFGRTGLRSVHPANEGFQKVGIVGRWYEFKPPKRFRSTGLCRRKVPVARAKYLGWRSSFVDHLFAVVVSEGRGKKRVVYVPITFASPEEYPKIITKRRCQK